MKNNFDFHRFILFLKHEIILGKSKYLNLLLAFLVTFVAITIMLSLSFWIGCIPVPSSNVNTIASLSAIVSGIHLMVSLSNSFSTIETPQKRIAMLMLPASQFEKYIGRILIALTIGIIGTIAGFVFTDALRVLFESIIWGNSATCGIPNYFSGLGTVFEMNISVHNIGSAYLNGMWVFAGTFFILCSTVFRKKAFIKGVGCYSLINIILGIGMSIFIAYAATHKVDTIDLPKGYIFDGVNICNIKFYLLSILNIYWSWKNYKKISVL